MAVKTAKKAAKKATRPAAAEVEEQETAAPAEKEVGTCLFSGQPTGSKRSRFLPGYDAKLKSVMLQVVKGEQKLNAIPPLAMKELRKGEPLLGFLYSKEDGLQKIDAEGNVVEVPVAVKKEKKAPPTATRPAKTSARKRSAQRAVQEEAEDDGE